jgi:large subunit ribosomal protein L6
VVVKGPKGELRIQLRPEIRVDVDKGAVRVEVDSAEGERTTRAYHGMTRALIHNMVTGVVQGFEKKLEIVGVGWNAAAQGDKLVLNVGTTSPSRSRCPRASRSRRPIPPRS